MTGRSKNLRLGYVPQRISIDRGMPLTVVEFRHGHPEAPALARHQPSLKAHSLEPFNGQGGTPRFPAAICPAAKCSASAGACPATEPELLVLDEPRPGWIFRRASVLRTAGRTARRRGFTQLMVSHDLGMVFTTPRTSSASSSMSSRSTPDSADARKPHGLFGMHMGLINPHAPPRTSQRTTMLDLEPLYRLVSLLPFECLQAGFMQQALVA
ncbi:MAG: hypothetical protein ACLSHC_15740 [Bilophila wadsworthia]